MIEFKEAQNIITMLCAIKSKTFEMERTDTDVQEHFFLTGIFH